jgi:hypothetical protein
MIVFVLVASLLTLAAAALVSVPLVRSDGSSNPPATKAAVAAAIVIALGAAACYFGWGNSAWKESASGDLPQNMVARLARARARSK